jgi:PAP2 superfamily
MRHQNISKCRPLAIGFAFSIAIAGLFAGMVVAPIGWAGSLEGANAAAAPSSLSADSKKELADLLAGPASWTTVSLFKNQLPRVAADVFDRYMLWNEIALDTTAIDHTPLVPGDVRPRWGEQFGPPRTSRAMAIVHIAMFEAVNAVTQRFRSYAQVPAADDKSLSLDRAIAQAAHDTLLSLYPAQQLRLDSLLAQDIALIGGTAHRLSAGEALGALSAATILALRAADGAQAPEVTVGIGPNNFHLQPGLSYWSPDPVSGLLTALGANWGRVKPFVLTGASQFRPDPPPALTSNAYTAAYNRVAVLGGDPAHGTPTRRTDRQTFIGRFWGYDGTPGLCAPPRLYNMIARTVALQQGMTNLSELARFLALVNTALGDAGIAAWDAKWFYQFWRPVMGIRYGSAVGNPETAGNPMWYPLGAPATNTSGPNFTPPFPAYPSGHATFGGALFELFRAYWPDNTAFTIVSDEYNGLNRDADGVLRPYEPQTFNSFSEAEYDNAESRIYDGVHWEFDATKGIELGHHVARFVIEHAFQRIQD